MEGLEAHTFEILLLQLRSLLYIYLVGVKVKVRDYRPVIGEVALLNRKKQLLLYLSILIAPPFPKDPVTPGWHPLLFGGVISLRPLIVFISGREVNVALCEVLI
jgi:hypothetical protein